MAAQATTVLKLPGKIYAIDDLPTLANYYNNTNEAAYVIAMTEQKPLTWDRLNNQTAHELQLLPILQPYIPTFIAEFLQKIISQGISSFKILAQEDVQKVLQVSINEATYILKIGQSMAWFSEVLHEGLVGLVLNTLQSHNFARVLAVTVDACPIDSPKPVRDMGHVCFYSLYEYIPGPTLRDYVNTAQIVEFASVLTQLYQALYHAYTEYQFTHYDLHTFNVIITERHGRKCPVIIDYGSALIRANINTRLYEIKPEIKKEAERLDYPMWYHDIFKITAFMYNYAEPRMILDTELAEIAHILERHEYDMEDLEEYIIHIEGLMEDVEGNINFFHEHIATLSPEADKKSYEAYQHRYAQEKDEYDMYRQRYDELQKQLNELEVSKQNIEQEREHLLKDPPIGNINIIPLLSDLLKFFLPIVNVDTMLQYKKEYAYFKPSPSMMADDLSYEQFMNYSSSLLNNYIK